MASASLSSSGSPTSPRPYVVTRPRLHRGHFCYLRAMVQGLAPRPAWERYLPEVGAFDDTPRVHRMTGWIRAELAAAAARGGDFARARLLRLDLAPPPEPSEPTLEDFALDQGLEACSEAEQLAAYEATYGSTLARTRRRARLLHRQLEAIFELEACIAQPVSPTDGVEAWITDALAQRLIVAGLLTLGALHARIAQGGTWWRDVPGIGVGKGQALERFVSAHAETLGPLPSSEDAEPEDAAARRAEVGHAAVASMLVPLERFQLPRELDGRGGRFRAPRERCLLQAEDDREAILAWLAAKQKASPVRAGRARPRGKAAGRATGGGQALTCTQLAYRKEAERFLLWAVLERRQALSSMAIEDCIAYRDFVLAPPSAWCGPRGQPRWTSGWRPFAGPLSPRSCAYALGVLGNLFGFLVNQGYLIGNPWRAVSPPCLVARGPDTGRGFTVAQWHLIQNALAALPPDLAAQRLQFALPLLHATGLRLAELVAATTDDLTWESLAEPGGALVEGWWLTVMGKGGKMRRVPVSPSVIRRLAGYLTARGLPPDPRCAGGVALLDAVNDSGLGAPRECAAASGITGSSFHRQLKRFLQHCAERLSATDPPAAERLRRASTHWLRHTHVSHALGAGVPVEVVQQNVGHASLDTTTRYVHTEDVRRLQAMQRMWQEG